ncbi:MAG: hypothetical protein ANIMEMIM_00227 [Candidatus Argoarchaeum ethanivorans]|uniref:Uncharacterized protein n=1 Tax=Candidatus Argoarchaeum ethanivorans TaxID=2608793 RepID=A0A811T8A0_9EURY|nr:MAG: hypothetical protein ANIMEMIM_00227 [Candidatus Argoarchaeum ethanivorans]
MPIGNPKDEYKDISANMCQYGNMRFAQLTLFIAMTAGLLTALFTSNPPLSSLVRFVLKVGGLIITVVFWIMEERATDYWHHFGRRHKRSSSALFVYVFVLGGYTHFTYEVLTNGYFC